MKKPYFSVLMSVYDKEDARNLDVALSSIKNQTLPPNELILVKDGPLNRDLESIINKHSRTSPFKFKTLSLDENVGLWKALNFGLHACSYDWIARMDSDDISDPERFEKQFSFLAQKQDIDILGGYICEFIRKPNEKCLIRKVPLDDQEIKKVGKVRNPFNHVTVVFRKSFVERVGCYESFPGFEDYQLWIKLIMAGAKTANMEEILVFVRIGDEEMLSRRRGMAYVKNELLFFKWMYKVKYIGLPRYCYNVLLRTAARVLPMSLQKLIYKMLRESQKGERYNECK